MNGHFALAAAAAALIATSVAAAPAPDGKNRKILIQNDSSQTINELYASPSTNTTWEENLFGQRNLSPGHSINANIDNGTTECTYDLKLVFASAKAIEQRKVNVCSVGRWLITDTGNSFDSGGQAAAQTSAPTRVTQPSGMVRPQDPQSLVNVLQANGYPAELTTDSTGDPMIKSKVAGTTFEIFFYNCTNHRDCATVQFHSGYHMPSPTPLTVLNEWNQSERFGRGFLDKKNDPVIEMDVDLDDGGVAPLLFIDNLEFWESILPKFEQKIGYRKS